MTTRELVALLMERGEETLDYALCATLTAQITRDARLSVRAPVRLHASFDTSSRRVWLKGLTDDVEA